MGNECDEDRVDIVIRSGYGAEILGKIKVVLQKSRVFSEINQIFGFCFFYFRDLPRCSWFPLCGN